MCRHESDWKRRPDPALGRRDIDVEDESASIIALLNLATMTSQFSPERLRDSERRQDMLTDAI
jgi:hypothetical protein